MGLSASGLLPVPGSGYGCSSVELGGAHVPHDGKAESLSQRTAWGLGRDQSDDGVCLATLTPPGQSRQAPTRVIFPLFLREGGLGALW